METRTRAQVFAELAAPQNVRWRRDPAGWATDRAKVEIWSKQRQILEAVRDHPRVAIPSCHSAGKSYTMGLLCCWWVDAHPAGEARVISTAPTSKQVDAVLWNEINQHHERIGLQGHTNKREWYLGKFLAALGRKPPDHVEAAFQGLHARHLLVIFDEAYGIPLHLWNEGSSLASNENARMVAVGNPDGSGMFEDICKPGSGWHVIPISYRDTPNFTDELVSDRLREMLISPGWVEDRRRVWGENSALFVAKCEGRFPTVGSPWQVVPHDWAVQCRYLEMPVRQTDDVEAGVDVGAGNDRTVVTIRRGGVILHIQEFVSPDPTTTVGAIVQTLREWDVKTVKVDSIGVGWGVYGHLRALSSKHNSSPLEVLDAQRATSSTGHDASVVPINVATTPTVGNEHIYYNRRAEMWWLGRELSRTKNWDLSRLDQDTQDRLIRELTMPEYKIVDAKGQVQIESKKKIIERLGASPDVAESALLAFVPASWSAETHTDGLLAAPSLLSATMPGDLLSGRGLAPWDRGASSYGSRY
jgi:hypothetical protein